MSTWPWTLQEHYQYLNLLTFAVFNSGAISAMFFLFQLRNVENEPVVLLVAHPAGQWLQLLQSPEEEEQKNIDIIYLPNGKY